jgi:hypothetical protein
MEIPSRGKRLSNAKLYFIACLATTYIFAAASGLVYVASILK